jgi:hypothetical protein
LRSGLIGFSCDKCEAAPYIKDQLGCEKPLETAAEWWDGDEFYSCPVKFIMQSVYEMIEKMDSYNKRLSTPPAYEKQSARFLSGVRAFENYLIYFTSLKKGE